jgi:hypothetical protein
MSHWKKKDRVKVNIAGRTDWNEGAIKMMHGKLGVVEEVKAMRTPVVYLVRFDTPAEKWDAHGSAKTGFHFEAHELEAET